MFQHSSCFSSSSYLRRLNHLPLEASFQPWASSQQELSRRRWTSSPQLVSSLLASSLPLVPLRIWNLEES
ncbi:hypothetical protein MtrunA17_Chr4g0031661 [Medicago truncatula]|uniref:Uncharacterized protein n=1 Tax=Medicago truncatula TaxID=3880 RepID=A0A396I5R7_MEDTR|nr:hypothetical protein MtrunA17_Chr4g0031661 [Medicago truncatula]